MPDIDFQKIVLNLIPKKGDEPVIFYASQYETTRPFIADLMWGDTEFAPGDDCWAEIDIRKNDDNLVVITDDVSIDNNEVSVILPVQAVTCIGNNLGQIKIYAADEQLIAALNFILHVQPDPLAGGVTSESDIDNLTQQIEDIATEVIGEDYYDKTEVDALLNDKADVSDLPDMSQYYTKTATDTLLSAKADTATTYTKSETDSLLSAKANTADLATVATTGDYDDLINKPTIPAAQVQSDYAQADNTQVDYIKNKPDISGMIAAALLAVMPVDSATGNPCTFDTDIATSLVGLSADIVASGGGGTPSTPIPIVGHSELNLVRCGKNLLDAEVSAITPSLPISAVTQNINIGADCVFSMTASADYANSDNYWLVYIQKLDGTRTYITPTAGQTKTQAFTVTSDNPITAIYYRNSGVTAGSVTNFQIELGTTPSAYAPYNGTPYLVSFGQTVYGGEYDANTGKVTITCDSIDLGTLTYQKTNVGTYEVFYADVPNKAQTVYGLCTIYKCEGNPRDYLSDNEIGTWNTSGNRNRIAIRDDSKSSLTPEQFKTAMNGVQFVFEIATPIEIDVSSISVEAVVGTNTITSDCNGDVTASYKVSIQKYIDDNV